MGILIFFFLVLEKIAVICSYLDLSQPFWLYVILEHNKCSVNTWVLYMLCRNKLQDKQELSLLLE